MPCGTALRPDGLDTGEPKYKKTGETERKVWVSEIFINQKEHFKWNI